MYMETNPYETRLYEQGVARLHYYKKLGTSIPLRYFSSSLHRVTHRFYYSFPPTINSQGSDRGSVSVPVLLISCNSECFP